MTMTIADTWFRPDSSRTAALSKLRWLRRLAWFIDAAGHIPGTRLRFGANSVIGLAPWTGDAVLALISLYIVVEGARLGLPRAKIMRMLINVGVEAGIGFVPVLGDILDMAWKANLRNVAILDEHFGVPPAR